MRLSRGCVGLLCDQTPRPSLRGAMILEGRPGDFAGSCKKEASGSTLYRVSPPWEKLRFPKLPIDGTGGGEAREME